MYFAMLAVCNHFYGSFYSFVQMAWQIKIYVRLYIGSVLHIHFVCCINFISFILPKSKFPSSYFLISAHMLKYTARIAIHTNATLYRFRIYSHYMISRCIYRWYGVAKPPWPMQKGAGISILKPHTMLHH